MEKAIRGKCWVFDNNIDTDVMAPGTTLNMEWEEKKRALFPQHPGLSLKVEQGDIFVAGENWGCGSSREIAVDNLVDLGVTAVVAESFARIFFRNAVARALPAIVCPGIRAACEEGDVIHIDWHSFTVRNETKNLELKATPYNAQMKSIIEQGGLMNLLKQRLDEQRIATDAE